MSYPPLRRRAMVAAVALLVTVAALATATASPAAAAPSDPPDETGGNTTLLAVLTAASKDYLDAKAALEASQARQAELTAQLTVAENRLASLTGEAQTIASAAYRTQGLRTASALLSSASPDSFMDRVTSLEVIARRQNGQLREVTQARRHLADAKTAVDAEVTKQQQQLALMAQKKAEAEKALASFGGDATSGPTGGGSATAQPAPRRNGSWPAESCSVNDPTTSGCITPRTLHALQQAKAAGFTRYVSCFRSGGSGEHPKGRACDFAADQNGFGGVATGDDRIYGNNLAAYLVRNANALAVLYVIWFKQIWLPSSGWRAYRSGNGDPSSDHTNHVHLSVY